MVVKVLHNGNCSKSNAVLSIWMRTGDFEIINIIEDPLVLWKLKQF
jgi:arsenate reductase